MKNDLSFLGTISEDDRLLAVKVIQWVKICEEKYLDKYTFFLNEHEKLLCTKVLNSLCCKNYKFYGGYDSASRNVLGIFNPYSDKLNNDFPIRSFTFKYRDVDKLTHRDFLGCIMSLGISRATVGDILISDGNAAVFVYVKVADLIMGINKIGNKGVKVVEGIDNFVIPKQCFAEIEGTVASLRMDCILSLALKISREKASAIIRGGDVTVNFMKCNLSDYHLSVGDVFSVRGYGKFIYDKCGSLTKKNRIHIRLKKYI